MQWYAVEKVSTLGPVEAAELDWLDGLCFPEDELENKFCPNTTWWIVREYPSRRVVGFCAGKILESENVLYLSRAGVIEEARGKGLQRRMIKTRVAFAMNCGLDYCITYTVLDNHASSNNLIRCGFMLYEPEYPWCDRKVLYWRRSL